MVHRDRDWITTRRRILKENSKVNITTVPDDFLKHWKFVSNPEELPEMSGGRQWTRKMLAASPRGR